MNSGARLALASVSGALAGALGWVDPGAGAAVGVGAVALLALPMPGGLRGWLVAAAVCAGLAGHAGVVRQQRLASPLSEWFSADGRGTGGVAELTGTIVEDAAPARDDGVRLTVDVVALRTAGREAWVDAPGRARFTVSGALASTQASAWTRGRSVRATAIFRRPSVIRNPGSTSVEWQTLTRDYALAGSIKSASLVHVTPGPFAEELAARLRRGVRRAAVAVFPDRPDAAALVIAILIGDRAGLDPGLERRLTTAGTYHVIAVSGGNVAVLTALVLAATRLTCRSARVASLLAMGAILVYGATLDREPSVTRAVMCAVLWCGAGAAGLHSNPLAVLATVASLALVLDPWLVVSVAAWLSFGATCAILVLGSRVLDALSPPAPGVATRGWRVARALLGLVAASVAVQMALLPVGAWVFGRIALAAIPLNLVAVPAMALVQVFGGLALMLWAVWPPAAALLAPVVTLAIWALSESPGLVTWAPWLSQRTAAPPIWWGIAFYLSAIAAVAASLPGVYRIGLAVLTAGLAVSAPLIAARAVVRPHPGELRVTVLDVGQGDATLVEFPDRSSLLIDGGNRSAAFDVGERVVVPALLARGIRRLDWAALSHPDQDHAGGLAAVIAAFRPREIWEGIPVPSIPARDELFAAARSVGAVRRELRAGDRLEVSGVLLDVAHPAVPDWERRRVRNDDSLVLRLRYGELDMVLPGDAGQAVEAALVTNLAGDRGRFRLLKAGHHGSRSSTSDLLLQHFQPLSAIVSSGQGNAFGHPSPEVIARLEAHGARVFRTDQDGALTIVSDGGRALVSTWTGWAHRLVAAPPLRRP